MRTSAAVDDWFQSKVAHQRFPSTPRPRGRTAAGAAVCDSATLGLKGPPVLGGVTPGSALLPGDVFTGLPGSKMAHMSDLRFAVRMLAKSPGFTAVAVALLAVGVGANALIFSAFDAVLWRPLPVRHAEELVRMVQRIPRIGTSSTFHYSFYQALRDHSTTLSAVFGEAPIDVVMNQPAPAEQVRVHMATPEFFEVLGVPALFGRTLTEDDATATPETPPAVLELRLLASTLQRRSRGRRADDRAAWPFVRDRGRDATRVQRHLGGHCT